MSAPAYVTSFRMYEAGPGAARAWRNLFDRVFADARVEIDFIVVIDIFDDFSLKCPVIFTTAYDEYAIRAFKVNGIDYFLELTEFENELKKCDLVITGEGSIDMQTLQGKGPFGVAKMAKQKNKPVMAGANQTPGKTNQQTGANNSTIPHL